MLSEDEAREIALHWHGGQWTSLYAFCSSSHIDEGLLIEIESLLHGMPDDDYYKELCSLKLYIEQEELKDIAQNGS